MGAIVTIKARVQSRSESLSIEVVGVCQCPSSDILWQHKVLDLTPNILPALRFAHFRQLEIKFQHTMLGKLILSSPLRLLRKMALLPKKSLLCHSSRMLMDFLRHAIPRPKSKSGSTFLWIGSKTWMALRGMFSPTLPCVPAASPLVPVHFRRLHPFGRPRQMPVQSRTEQQPQRQQRPRLQRRQLSLQLRPPPLRRRRRNPLSRFHRSPSALPDPALHALTR